MSKDYSRFSFILRPEMKESFDVLSIVLARGTCRLRVELFQPETRTYGLFSFRLRLLRPCFITAFGLYSRQTRSMVTRDFTRKIGFKEKSHNLVDIWV
jgi:hypothetical protein